MKAQDRVVVTGMGVVAPNGIGLDDFWDSLINCKSGIGPITLFDTSECPLKIAGEVKNFDLRDYFGKDCKPHRLARQTQLGLVAYKMALEHAGLTADILRKMEPISLVMGICSGAVDLTEQAKETVMTRGAKRVRPHIVGSCQPHAIGAALVQMLGVQTSVTTISAACPSGLDAVAAASKMIKEGRTDMVVVGAADSPLNISTAASFCAAGIPPISTNFPAEEISRPFDAKSEGGPMSEGAGFVILERLDSALARGATLYGEVLSGATITDPPGKGSLEGLSQTMEMALSNAGILPDQISYICANAIGNLTGDRMETKLIKKVFKSAAYQIPISSIKGVTGNPLAAAGIFQVITCILSMTRGMIPPTANLTNPDPQCDLDYVPLKPRSIKVTYALANMHGMGGENSTLIVKRV